MSVKLRIYPRGENAEYPLKDRVHLVLNGGVELTRHGDDLMIVSNCYGRMEFLFVPFTLNGRVEVEVPF